MADMFGAPIGIGQAEADQRQNVMGGLLALHKMGEIEAQPTDLELKKAHARLFNAEAYDKEITAMQNAAMIGPTAEVFGGGTGGGGPGVFHNGTTGEAPSSMADPLFSLARIAGSRGFLMKSMDLYTKGVDIVRKESVIGNNQAKQTLAEVRAEQIQNEQDAAIASNLLTQGDQAGYDQMRMILNARGEDISWMPQDFNDPRAKRMLEMVRDQGISAKDQLAARAKKVVDDARVRALTASATAAGASANLSGIRAKVARQRYDDVTKNGGDTTGGARALREERRKAIVDATKAKAVAEQAKADAQAARDRKNFPPPTPEQLANNGAGLRAGQSYSTPKGVLTWTGTAFVPMRIPPAARTSSNTGAAADTLLEDDDDDGDD